MFILEYYNEQVLSIQQYTSTIAFSNSNKIVGDIEDLFKQATELELNNISIFWKSGYINNIIPSSKECELDISDHPNDESICRKAFVHKLSINYSKEKFIFGTIVRHFDKNTGNHIKTEDLDDEYYSSKADNSTILFYNGDINSSLLQSKPIKEYDYYVNLINNSNNIFDMQLQGILLLDNNKRFDSIY